MGRVVSGVSYYNVTRGHASDWSRLFEFFLRLFQNSANRSCETARCLQRDARGGVHRRQRVRERQQRIDDQRRGQSSRVNSWEAISLPSPWYNLFSTSRRIYVVISNAKDGDRLVYHGDDDLVESSPSIVMSSHQNLTSFVRLRRKKKTTMCMLIRCVFIFISRFERPLRRLCTIASSVELPSPTRCLLRRIWTAKPGP